MTATALSTARPPTTAIAWVAGDSIYCEIPCKGGLPYIARYHKTAEGLQQALSVLLDNPAPTAKPTTQSAHPAVRRVKPTFDESERQGVRDILKGLKII